MATEIDTPKLIDPTVAGALTGEDIPPEILALAMENTSDAIGTILAGQVGDEPVDSGDAHAPSLDQLARQAEGQFGGAAKVHIGEGARIPHITLWRALDGLPRHCMLVYTDSTGRNHDYGMKYLKKRHTAESHPENPEMWGKPIFLPRPPKDAPLKPRLAAQCPRCQKRLNDEFEVDKHLRKKHPMDFERLEAQRDRDDQGTFQSAIVSNQEQISRLVTAIMSGTGTVPAEKPRQPDSTEGVFRYAREAAEYFGISKDQLVRECRNGKRQSGRDKKGLWLVWVPDPDWTPAES